MPSRVSRMTLPAMTWPVEFQTWMPLPRRFWLSGDDAQLAFAGLGARLDRQRIDDGSAASARPRMVLPSIRAPSAWRT